MTFRIYPALTPAPAAPIVSNVFLSAANQATQRMRTAVCHSTALAIEDGPCSNAVDGQFIR